MLPARWSSLSTRPPTDEASARHPGGRDSADHVDTIAPHLYEVASTIDRVAVKVDGEALFGNLLFPDVGGRTVPFEPRRSVLPHLPTTPDLAEGRLVTVLYGRGDERYRFLARVVSPFGDGGFRLELPDRIESARPRLARRQAALGAWRFRLRGSCIRLPVMDLSLSGLALGCDPVHGLPPRGAVLTGRLEGPDGQVIDARMRQVRVIGRAPGSRFVRVGCRFSQLGMLRYAQLAAALYDADDLLDELRTRDAP